MTNIVGLLRDSGRLPLNVTLRVTLDASFVDSSTTPDSFMLPVQRSFPISNGVLSIDLAQSETSNISYQFEILSTTINAVYFTNAGNEYSGPVILHVDGIYYAGFAHSPTAAVLYRVEQSTETLIESFHALVPNVLSVEFTALKRTGISNDILDSSIRRLAALLTSDEQYAAILRGGPYVQGNYNASIYYKKDDLVQYAGSAWLYIANTSKVGQTPSEANAANWLKFGAKGDPGAGVTGQDTAFDPTGWNGATWVPTANAIRDYLVLLAPLTSPALGGTPTCPTPASPSNDLTVINSAWARILLAASFTDTVLVGNPTIPTTPPFTQADTRGVNAAWVKGVYHRYSRVADRKASGVNGGSSVAGFNTRVLQTIGVNAGDIISVTANVVTLRPGTYRFAAQAPCNAGGFHRLDLFSNTAGVSVANQVNILSFAGTGATTTATASGIFTIAANTAFILRHNITIAVATTGMGPAMNTSGVDEIYAVIEFWRID